MERRMTSGEVHAELKRLLTEFVTFCDEHDLRYFLAYGSLLGAVREGDFIPWDDDVDVLMPRPDYERFQDLYAKNAHPSFILMVPGDTDYPSSFAKLVSARTRFESKDHLFPANYGVYLDIFPLDGVPARVPKAHFWAVQELTVIRHKAYPKDKPHAVREDPSIPETAKRFVWQVLNQPTHLPAWFKEQNTRLRQKTVGAAASKLPRATLAGWAEAVASQFDYEKAGVVADYFGWTELEDALIDRAHVDDFTYVEIDGLQVKTFARPEILLEQWYGDDWQTPQPDFKPPHGAAFWREGHPSAELPE